MYDYNEPAPYFSNEEAQRMDDAFLQNLENGFQSTESLFEPKSTFDEVLQNETYQLARFKTLTGSLIKAMYAEDEEKFEILLKLLVADTAETEFGWAHDPDQYLWRCSEDGNYYFPSYSLSMLKERFFKGYTGNSWRELPKHQP